MGGVVPLHLADALGWEESPFTSQLFREELRLDERMFAPQPFNLLLHERPVFRHFTGNGIGINAEHALDAVVQLGGFRRAQFAG